jgi:hypothetical protein
MRTYLHIAEIVIWTLGCYLLVCLLTRPPRERSVVLADATVAPFKILEQTHDAVHSSDTAFAPLVPDPFLQNWKHVPSSLNGSLYRLSISEDRPNLPRISRLLLTITGTTLLATTLCRRMRNRIPLPPAFEVSVNICGPVS